MQRRYAILRDFAVYCLGAVTAAAIVALVAAAFDGWTTWLTHFTDVQTWIGIAGSFAVVVAINNHPKRPSGESDEQRIWETHQREQEDK